MDPIRPIPPAGRAVERWLDRRRRNLEAQLDAAERQGWDDLERLLAEAASTEGPTGGDETADGLGLADLLAQADALTRRLAEARRRLLTQIEEAPGSPSEDPPPSGPERKGDRLDGYV